MHSVLEHTIRYFHQVQCNASWFIKSLLLWHSFIYSWAKYGNSWNNSIGWLQWLIKMLTASIICKLHSLLRLVRNLNHSIKCHSLANLQLECMSKINLHFLLEHKYIWRKVKVVPLAGISLRENKKLQVQHACRNAWTRNQCLQLLCW